VLGYFIAAYSQLVLQQPPGGCVVQAEVEQQELQAWAAGQPSPDSLPGAGAAITSNPAVHLQKVTLFSLNDYLGLSTHPDVRRAAAEAAARVSCPSLVPLLNRPQPATAVSSRACLLTDASCRLCAWVVADVSSACQQSQNTCSRQCIAPRPATPLSPSWSAPRCCHGCNRLGWVPELLPWWLGSPRTIGSWRRS
jgi:hypothetical protein